MILKASTRGNAVALGRHLTNAHDNDHIEQHEIRGFIADDVMGAMAELHAISQGIKSRQPLFSVSLSPPQMESVGIDIFERAIEEIEQRNGLRDQPRIVIFHEKEGRRHAHAVWSRIDAERMIAIPIPFYKNRLQEISREIFLEQQWDLPRGLIDRTQRNPCNFDLAHYQQAKREGRDPKQIKLLAQQAWAVSDNRDAFQQALEERGLYLAKGDRRAHVAITWRGEVMSLSRLLGRKSKEVRDRLGSADNLRDIDSTHAYIAQKVAPTLQKVIGEAERQKAERLQPLERERVALRDQHHAERQRMDAGLATRQAQEGRERSTRLRTGLAGLLDRVTGRQRETQERNAREAWEALQRDRQQRQAMIDAQLAERQCLQQRMIAIRHQHEEQVISLHRDLARQLEADRSPERTERLQWLQDQQRIAQADRLAWLQQDQRRPSNAFNDHAKSPRQPDRHMSDRHIDIEPGQ